jgi:hypothetical protein
MQPRYQLALHQDDRLYVGVAKVDIMPLPYGQDGSCPPGKFCFETHKNLGAADGCPKNEDNRFEGQLALPAGRGCLEPFTDANRNGVYDGLWLGGYNIARAATDVDRDVSIYVKVMVLTFNREHVVFVNLPFVGFPTMQLSFLRERLAALSGGTIAKERIVPMVQHNHGVPDSQGLWGPGLFGNADLRGKSGTDPSALLEALQAAFGSVDLPLPSLNYRNNAYWFWVEERVVEAVGAAVAKLEPAALKLGVRETPHRETGCLTKPFAGTVELDCNGNGVTNEGSDLSAYGGGDVGSDCLKKGDPRPVRHLVEDLRLPFAMDYNVYTLQFVSQAASKPLVTFVVWGHHVEEGDAENTKITGDIAEYACDFIERRGGGTCIFQIGPEGGLTSSNTGAIPYLDEAGRYYDCKGNPYPDSEKTDDFLKYLDEGELKYEKRNYHDAIAAGRQVAKTSLASLEASPAVHRVARMEASHQHALVPLDNPFLYFAGKLEILNGMSLLLREGIGREGGAKIKDIVFKGELGPGNLACGGAACIRSLLSVVSLELVDPQSNKQRRVAIATAPGELFPDYLVGREASSVRFREIDTSSKLKGMGDVPKDPSYPKDLFATDLNPQVFVAVEGLKEVGRKAGFDEVIVLAQTHGSLGYMMPRTDYLPYFEGYFDLIGLLAPGFDKLLTDAGGLHAIYRLSDNDRNLTIADVIAQVKARFPAYVKNYTPPGGPDVQVSDHPNAYEESVSSGPRTGDIVYNAISGLLRGGGYEPRRQVPNDPNTDAEVLSLGKLGR